MSREYPLLICTPTIGGGTQVIAKSCGLHHESIDHEAIERCGGLVSGLVEPIDGGWRCCQSGEFIGRFRNTVLVLRDPGAQFESLKRRRGVLPSQYPVFFKGVAIPTDGEIMNLMFYRVGVLSSVCWSVIHINQFLSNIVEVKS